MTLGQVIALQTFIVVWWGRTRRTQSLKIAYAVMSTVWLFVIFFVGASAGAKRNPESLYITPTPVRFLPLCCQYGLSLPSILIVLVLGQPDISLLPFRRGVRLAVDNFGALRIALHDSIPLEPWKHCPERDK
jgi:hypothetical protein